MENVEIAKRWVEYFSEQGYFGTATLCYQNGLLVDVKLNRNYKPEELELVKG